MTSIDTATAARIARVTVATIRAWCQLGAVSAVKVSGRWVIDSDSLARRVTLGRTLRAQKAVIDLSAFRDAKAAKAKAVELISEGGIVPASRPGLYLATASDGRAVYFVDAWEPFCTCDGFCHTARCYHLVAALLVDGRSHAAA